MTRLVERRYFPWLCWGLLALVYLLQNGLLVFPEAIYTELQQDLSLSPTQLGFLSSAFLYSWAAMQIPVGLLVDRFNVRYLTFFMTLLMGFGCLLMAFSSDYDAGLVARFIMGVGGSYAFVAALYLGRGWFVASLFPLIVGLTEAQSGVGEIVFQAIFGELRKAYDWRLLILLAGLLVIIVAFLILLYVRDKEAVSRKEKVSIYRDMKVVFTSKRVWLLALFTGFAYAHFEAMADMWGVTFLQLHYHLSEWSAIIVNGFVIVGYIIGCPLLGFLTRYFHPRRLMLVAALIEVFCLYFISYVQMSLFWGTLVLFVLGVVTAACLLSFDLAELVVPKHSYGVAAGLINTLFAAIGVILMPIIGYSLAQHPNQVVNEPSILFLSTVMALIFAIAINVRRDFHLHEEVFAAAP